MNVNFRLWREAVLRFKIIKDRMKLYYFISTKVKRIKRILRWFNWAWVDTYAHRFIPITFAEIIKAFLVAFYGLLGLAFIILMFYSLIAAPWLACVCCIVGFLALPILANLLEVPLKKEE